MQLVTDAGAIVMPPAPAFYIRPKTIAELVDHTIQRALDLLGLHLEISPRWSGLS